MKPWAHAALAGAIVIGCANAAASGLQVAPVSVTLLPSQNADGLWLSNTGDSPIHAQVRVFKWLQRDGEDRLEPCDALAISPPMLQVPPEGRQLVRVIRMGAPPQGVTESAYRVVVDELPIDRPDQRGVNFVLRYSLPVFVEPAGAGASPPQLTWSITRDGDKATLEIRNSGGTHAQIANIALTDATGRHVDVATGLIGYALPGATMRWAVRMPPEIPTPPYEWEAMVNGSTTPQKILVSGDRP